MLIYCSDSTNKLGYESHTTFLYTHRHTVGCQTDALADQYKTYSHNSQSAAEQKLHSDVNLM